MDRAVIIGGGLAGASAAFGLREAGFGGEVTLIGEEPHAPYERPPLSKGYLRGEEPMEQALVRPLPEYEQRGIVLMSGARAVTIDRARRLVQLADGRELPYDRLLIATGSAARKLAVPGADLDGVMTLRSVEDADAIRSAADQAQRVVVVGGGWIGSEVAASLGQLGHRVTLVTAMAGPLQRVLGPEVADLYADLHRANGIELVTGTVTGVLGADRAEGVRLHRGELLPAQLVIAGIGAMPRLELARRAGLEVTDGGIAADAQLRTSDPAIFVAGDVAAAHHPRFGHRLRVEHWDNARRQGATAARNMLGAGEAYARIPYFYSDQFDLGMEYRGYAPTWDRVEIRGDIERREFLAFWLRDGRIAAAMNANRWDDGEALADLVERAASAAEIPDAPAPARTDAA